MSEALRGFCLDLWVARRFILSGLALALVLATLIMVLVSPYRTAQMILAPANPMNGAEMSSLLANNNLFALRYVVQRMGGNSDSDLRRFEAVYKGPSVSKILLEDPLVKAGIGTDTPHSFLPAPAVTDEVQLADYIARHVHFGRIIGGSALRSLSYRHPNPEFALYFLERIHEVTDRLIRETIARESTERVAYLKEAVQVTHHPEHRRALTALLLEQERLLMLVSLDQAYAAAIVEPPALRLRPIWPDPFLVFPIFILVGLFGGYGLYFLSRRG